jgi:RNase P subunit RPR2
LRESPESVQQILAASESAGVPVDVALAHWSMESFMAPSGPAGRNSALGEIERHVRQGDRINQFRKNKDAFLVICQKCGYYKQYGRDCRQLKGSSTGALGPMQFQPLTWGDPSKRQDLDGDGVGCPLTLAEAFYALVGKLRGHADLARKYGMNWHLIAKKEKVTIHSPIPQGLLETEWDFAILRYAGEYCNRNYSYVRRSKLIRPHLCRMIREATGQALPCSMEPTDLLASN